MRLYILKIKLRGEGASRSLHTSCVFGLTLGVGCQGELSRLKTDRATGQMFSQMTGSKAIYQMCASSSTDGGTSARQGVHAGNQRHRLCFQAQHKNVL